MGQVRYGYYVASGRTPNKATVGTLAEQAVAQRFSDKTVSAGRILQVGSYTGYQTSIGANMTKRWAVYLPLGNGTPGKRLAGTTSAIISTSYDTNSGGANFSANIDPNLTMTEIDGGRLRKGRSGHPLIYKNESFSVADIDSHQSDRRTPIGQSNNRTKGNNFYKAHADVGVVPDPFNSLATATQDTLSIWFLYEENRAPVATITGLNNPEQSGPGNYSIVGETNPQVSITFSDQDRTDGYNDYPTEIVLSIRRWDGVGWTTPQSATYRSSQHYPQPSNGTGTVTVTVRIPVGILQQGETYRIHAQVKDELGESSAGYDNISSSWSAQAEIKVAEGGRAETISPSGKIVGLTPNFNATYRNLNAVSMTHVQLQLLQQTGGSYTTVATSPWITKAVALDDNFTVNWADTGFASLVYGRSYAIQFRVRDSTGAEGDWTGRMPFSTNYAPNAPTLTSPINSAQQSAAPLLVFSLVDQDDTPVADGGSLSAQVEISGPYSINGTFDVNDTGWTTDSNPGGLSVTRGRTTTTPRTGAGAYDFNITANSSGAAADSTVYSAYHPCVVGSLYTFSGYARLASANVSARLGFRWYDASNSLLATTWGTAGGLTTGYGPLQVSGSAPTNAVKFRVVMRATSNANGNTGSVKFDDLTINAGARYVVSATKRSGSNTIWEYQTTSGVEVNISGTYTWRARGDDTVLTGSWSSAGTFLLAAGQDVTITNPDVDEVFETDQPNIGWDITTTQAGYRVVLFRAGVLIYDSLYVASTLVRNHLIPSGYIHAIDPDLSVQVQITDDASAIGYSPIVPFSVSYTEPAPVENLVAAELTLAEDDEPTAIQLSWDAVDTSPEMLISMDIYRSSTKYGDEMLASITGGVDPGQYIDFTPSSGIEYTYTVHQRVQQGSDNRRGENATVIMRTSFSGAVLQQVGSESSERVTMRFWTSADETFTQLQNFVIPMGGSDYVQMASASDGRDFTLTWQVVDAAKYDGASGISALRWKEKFESLFSNRGVMNFRDATGNNAYVLFNGNPTIRRLNRGASLYTINVPLRRVMYDPVEE